MNDPATQFAEALRQARGDRSLLEISGAAKISTAYLHKLEAGRVGNPSPRVLERIAGVLDIPYWMLMELAGYVPAEERPPRRRRRKEESSMNDPGQRDGPTNTRIVELLAEIGARLERLEQKQDALSRQLENVEPHR